MKTFLLVLLLGVIAYLGYRRANDYGWPWEAQVVITRADHSMRGRNSNEVFIDGELKNRTRTTVTALVECKVLPGGTTLSPKAATTVELPPSATVEFRASTRTNKKATGLECKVAEWQTGRGLEDRWLGKAKSFFRRFF